MLTKAEFFSLLRERGMDVPFGDDLNSGPPPSLAECEILLSVVPRGDADTNALHLSAGMAIGRNQSPKAWWLIQRALASGEYREDAFLGLANALVDGFRWTPETGPAYLAILFDATLDDQRCILLMETRRFPISERLAILERAVGDPVLRVAAEDKLASRRKRAAAADSTPVSVSHAVNRTN